VEAGSVRVLVVGANGQLGARCCGKLMSSGHTVRAVVRTSQRGERVASMGAEVVLGDLRAPDASGITWPVSTRW